MHYQSIRRLLAAALLLATAMAQAPSPTREFEIRDNRAHLGGQPIEIWGIRCANALYSQTVTERHVRALDNMVAHGINALAVYIQGGHGGWPNADAGLNGFHRDGRLKAEVARRLEWLIRECDSRGMVVCVGGISPRKDQHFDDEAAVQKAMQELGAFLQTRGLRNVFVDLVHEFDHTDRADLRIIREPDGASKKQKLAEWFRSSSKEIEVGICPYEKSPTTPDWPGMDFCIIQKSMAIPRQGFVVNIETQKQDAYENDGVFAPSQALAILDDCARYHAAPNACMFFHAAYIQGIGNHSGTAPHPEIGGTGTSQANRGVRFYYEWVRDNVGRWEYPRHLPTERVAKTFDAPTREFEVIDERSWLGGHEVKLWGLRCNNSLLSPATTERLCNNIPNMAAHGINMVSISLQGTNGGFPDVDAGPNAYTPDGRLIPAFAQRVEQVCRTCDHYGMTVLLVLMMPRKDQLLRDEAAVRRAIESTATFLRDRNIRNVMVNIFQEFNHPTRIDHEIFREPFGNAKKAQLAEWWKAIAPAIEVGIVSNHLTGSATNFPGCDVQMIHEEVPIPAQGFVVNTETPDEDLIGREGVFTRQGKQALEKVWQLYLAEPRATMLFRSSFAEDVRGSMSTGPNLEMGGNGDSESDRGIRFFYTWSKDNLGRWQYPKHVRD